MLGGAEQQTLSHCTRAQTTNHSLTHSSASATRRSAGDERNAAPTLMKRDARAQTTMSPRVLPTIAFSDWAAQPFARTCTGLWSSAVHGVATLEAYLSRPIGQYLLGPTFVHWWSSPRLNGIMFWGRPEEEHTRIVVAALNAEFRSGVAPHASLIDVRRVSAVDLGAFTALLRFARDHREALARIVLGQAFLRPDGLPGAVVAGFPAVLDPPYPTRVFTDPVTALGWLGVEEEIATVAELDEIHARAGGGSAFVAAIRAYLEDAPDPATLQHAARAFGMSPRNLQRKLSEVHTTFQSEHHAALVRLAKNLLLETNYDLKRIAIEVGCASLQNFSALFHKSIGESPSQWRSRQRPDDFPARPAPRTSASQR